MEYKWDIKQIKRRRNNLLKLLVDPRYNKDSLYGNIGIYNDLISTYYNKTVLCDSLDDYSNSELHDLIDTFIDSYSYIDNDLLKILMDIFEKYYEDFEDIEEIELNENNISVDDIIQMTYAFFKNLGDKELYDDFEQIIDPSKHCIHIKKIDLKHDLEYGYTVVDDINKIPYAVINLENNINNLFTLPHEIMHMIFMKKLGSVNEKYNYWFLCETEGIFSDYAYLEFLDKQAKKLNISNPEIELMRRNYPLIINENLESLYVGKIASSNLKNRYHFDINKINDILHDKGLDITINNNLDQYITDDVSYNMQESTSFLSALDIFNHYQEDKEKGLYLLKKLRSKVYDSCFLAFDDTSITFHKDGYYNLNKELSKIKTPSKY